MLKTAFICQKRH